jgi:hypothetical protein
MDLLNATKMQAGYTMGMQPDGRELLVVVVKGTFTIPKNGEEPQLADEQVPLVEADVFTGEPGFSAPLYESDYPPYKPRCDVLLNGSAYAPGGKPTTKVRVSLTLGPIKKSFNVVGNRIWKKGITGISATRPKRFTVMPISYDNAFGGSDNTHKKRSKHKAHMLNPIGAGFHTNLKMKFIEGKPLPNTEELKHSVVRPKGKYKPMSFGPIGRGWEPRYKLAGTYDQNWIDNVFPFLPSDFNDAYYQAAPLDQQCRYLRGGEEVVLSNLTPYGHSRIQIPRVDVPVVFFLKKEEPYETRAVADTLLLEPDAGRIMITWRVNRPLKRNMFEVTQVLTGKMPRGWWRARELGKTYYRSLDEFIKEKRREAEEEME